MVDGHGPLKTGLFEVRIDEVEVPGWREVQLPAISVEQGDYREGNEAKHEKKTGGRVSFDDLEMERGVKPGDTKLHDWFEDVQNGKADSARKELSVTMQGEEDQESVQFRFLGAWITEYGPLDLSTDGDVAIESITVAFDRMVREEV